MGTSIPSTAAKITDSEIAVYSTEGRLAKKFVTSTKQALKSIASVTDLLKQHFELPDSQSVAGISRTSAYLHLLHHQVRLIGTSKLATRIIRKYQADLVVLVHCSHNEAIGIQLFGAAVEKPK